MATHSVLQGYKLVPDDGASTQTVVPEARGKAAARDRWLAQGKGNPDRMAKGAKFRHGPMKGLTYDQAKQKFESLWVSVPETLKEGYAQHARSGATPSEVAAASGDRMIPGITPTRVTNASLNASLPGETGAQTAERQKRSRILQQGGAYGVDGKTALAAYDESRKPKPRHDQDANGIPDMIQRPKDEVETPAQRRSTPGEERGEYGTVGTPEEQARVQAMVNEGSGFATAGGSTVSAMAAAAMQKKAAEAEAATPPSRNFRGGDKMAPFVPPVAIPQRGNPIVAPSVTQTPSTTGDSYSVADMKRADESRVAAMTSSPLTQAPASTEIQGPPRSAMPTIGTPSRINSLTGLPMGYRPGDSTAGLDQAKVAESNERVRTAPMIQGVTPAPPKATIAPAPVRYADAQEQYQSSQLDPAKAKEMDAVYAGASSLDQAKITAQSMKRAAGLQPRKPLIPDVAPTRPMSFARR